MKAKRGDRTKKEVVSDNFSVMESAIDLSILGYLEEIKPKRRKPSL
jgi:hypothetical protein